MLDLFKHGYIPEHATIVGFARSDLSLTNYRHLVHDSVRGKAEEEVIHDFLLRFHYVSGHYDSADSFKELDAHLLDLEEASIQARVTNRMFYFAIPPNVFISAATCIKHNCTSSTGWNRLVVEKPFGHDLASALDMNKQLGDVWPEESIYRMDHYLGKEMVQNLLMFRFGNIFLEPLMNNRYIAAVSITFKENFGTMGRGGYFDRYGILRDIMQNHLMQVLSLVAMEPPVRVAGIADGQDSAQFIRDAKVNVLRSISTLTMDDVVIGQYTADDKGNEGYLQDRTVPEDSLTPTFAQAVLRINTPRWEGVPFIMKAGKALDERKAEVRIQFKDAPAGSFMFSGQAVPRNELVFRLQPDEAVYMKVNVKKPGLFSNITQSELDLTYSSRFDYIILFLLTSHVGMRIYIVLMPILACCWIPFVVIRRHLCALMNLSNLGAYFLLFCITSNRTRFNLFRTSTERAGLTRLMRWDDV